MISVMELENIELYSELKSTYEKLKSFGGFNSEFYFGGGYIQQDKTTIKKLNFLLLKLCNYYYKTNFSKIDGGLGKLIYKEKNKYLRSSWKVLNCTDKNYKEWGQPNFCLMGTGVDKRLL